MSINLSHYTTTLETANSQFHIYFYDHHLKRLRNIFDQSNRDCSGNLIVGLQELFM